MPVNDGSNIRITPLQPMQLPDMTREASSLFTAMRRASGGGGGAGGLGGQLMFNPVTNKFERIPGGSFKERQLNMDAMNNMRVQAAWNNTKDTNVQAIQKKLQDFENASVERKNQIIDDIRRNDIPKLAGTSGIDGKAFITGPLKELEKRQQQAAQAVAQTGPLDVLWDSARIGFRNFTDSLADLVSNAEEQTARANARQQYAEQVRNENAYLQNSARRQAEGADFMDRFSGREVLAAAGEFAGQNLPTFGAMALGGALGAGAAGALGAGVNAVRGASLAGQALPGAVTGAAQQMTASVDAIMADTTKTTEQKMQELEDAQVSSRAFGGALGAVVLPVGQGIRRAVSSGLANRGIGSSQVAQAVRNQRAGKALPDEYLTWDAAQAAARRADIEAENAIINSSWYRPARLWQQAGDSSLEGGLFGAVSQLGTNAIVGDPLGTNMGAATVGGLVGGLAFTPFNRRTPRVVPDTNFVAGVDIPVGAPADVNQQRIVDAGWNAYDAQRANFREAVTPQPMPSSAGEFGFDRPNNSSYYIRNTGMRPNDVDWFLSGDTANFSATPLVSRSARQQQAAPRGRGRRAQQAQQPVAPQQQQQVAPQQQAVPQQQQQAAPQQPNLQGLTSSTPPVVRETQVPASASIDRLPASNTGEMGINYVGPNGVAPSAVAQQRPASTAPSATSDPALAKALRTIISKGGKYRKGAPKGGLHAASETLIKRTVESLTPEQRQRLAQLIQSNGGADRLSKVQYTRRAIQYAVDHINRISPEANAAFEQAIKATENARIGATPQELAAMTRQARAAQQTQEGANTNATTQQQTTVQGAGAEPAGPQQAAATAEAINAATGSSSEPQASRLEQPVNTGTPTTDRPDTGVDSRGQTTDAGTPATNANAVPASTPVRSAAAQERGNAGSEAQQPGTTPETQGTPEPAPATEQAAVGERGARTAAPANAEGSASTGSTRTERGTGSRDGGDAADTGSNEQPRDVAGDGDRAVNDPNVHPFDEEVLTREDELAEDFFNIEVFHENAQSFLPDGRSVEDNSYTVPTITASREDWPYGWVSDGDPLETDRTPVKVGQKGKVLTYDIMQMRDSPAYNDIGSLPDKIAEVLFPKGSKNTTEAPKLTVTIDNSGTRPGQASLFEFEYIRKKGSGNPWHVPQLDPTTGQDRLVPSTSRGEGMWLDKGNQLHISFGDMNPADQWNASGDGALVTLRLTDANGQEVALRTFPILPEEWPIRPSREALVRAGQRLEKTPEVIDAVIEGVLNPQPSVVVAQERAPKQDTVSDQTPPAQPTPPEQGAAPTQAPSVQPATPEQVERQKVATSSFNVQVRPDGSITSSREIWPYHRAEDAQEARKNVSFNAAKGILSYNVRRTANPLRNFVPSQTLYSSKFRNPIPPAILLTIDNAQGDTFYLTLRNSSTTKYEPNWIPDVENTGITVDKNMMLHIDTNTTNPELRRALSGDGAQVNVMVRNNGGHYINATSTGRGGSQTFPVYPNEWPIKPTVQETVQAKAIRDTAAAVEQDRRDNETSKKVVAPKGEGQNAEDASTVEALAALTKADAEAAPVPTPAQEAVKTPPKRTAKAQKKAQQKDAEASAAPARTRRKKVVADPAAKLDADAQAEARVESKIDPRSESYDYGQGDGMGVLSQRLRDLQEEQIDDMGDRIYELQAQGERELNMNPVSTEEAPAMVMSYIIDVPPNKLLTTIQSAGVRNTDGFRRTGSGAPDPMKIADAMTYALIANDISRTAADSGFNLKMDANEQAFHALALKQKLPPVRLSAEERGLLDTWLTDVTIPARDKTLRAAFDVLLTTPDADRKRILSEAQQNICAKLGANAKD